MESVLHLLTRPGDAGARDSVAARLASGAEKVTVQDLSTAEPDYDALVEAIFRADKVVVW